MEKITIEKKENDFGIYYNLMFKGKQKQGHSFTNTISLTEKELEELDYKIDEVHRKK